MDKRLINQFKRNLKRHLYEPIFNRPSCRAVVVCGPPGAGKNTYIAEKIKPNDVLIDLDEIKAKITQAPLYHESSEEAAEKALLERNRILYGLQERENQIGTVWFIISGGYASDRRWWQHALGAEVVVIDTPLNVCIKRIKQDNRRPDTAKVRHIEAARTWWDKYRSG